MAPKHRRHSRNIDPVVSSWLVKQAHDPQIISGEPSRPEIIDPLELLIGRLYNKKDPVHENAGELFQISNILSEQYGYLSAQAAMEALELAQIDNYDKWYMYIRGQLTQARNDAFDVDNFTPARNPQVREVSC